MVPKITMTDAPDARVKASILNPLVRFNEMRSGRRTNYRALAIFLSDPKTGEIVGGLWGETYFSYLYIDMFFVPQSMRGTGLGRRLITQAEEEAVRRGCCGVWLDTFSWQARGFYEKLGYSVFGTIDDYPPGHQRYFLRKVIGGT
jgi:GNAT superfamily N-acetyltransferase